MPARTTDLPPLTPAPPAATASLGARVLRVLARLLLWGLITAGALRGLLPWPPGGSERAVPQATRQQAGAVAAAFTREYLTVGDDPTGRQARLAPFLAAGAGLGNPPTGGTARYADQVQPAGVRLVGGTLEVTVLAHLLQLHGGSYRDEGMAAFIVPMVAGTGGVAVAGPPRPAPLPIESPVRPPRRSMRTRDATARPEPGWHPYQPGPGLTLPPWAAELVFTAPSPPAMPAAHAPGVVLDPGRRGLRAGVPGGLNAPPGEWRAGMRGGTDVVLALRVADRRPAVVVALAGAVRQLEVVAGVRREAGDRQRASWRAGAGAVLASWSPTGWVARAVVSVAGEGDPAVLAPPAGGALVLRAWRAARGWGLACGLVLAAPSTMGLGRAAHRLASRARAGGWRADVPIGEVAVALARAGDPRAPTPVAAGHHADEGAVAALLGACIRGSTAPDPMFPAGLQPRTPARTGRQLGPVALPVLLETLAKRPLPGG